MPKAAHFSKREKVQTNGYSRQQMSPTAIAEQIRRHRIAVASYQRRKIMKKHSKKQEGFPKSIPDYGKILYKMPFACDGFQLQKIKLTLIVFIRCVQRVVQAEEKLLLIKQKGNTTPSYCI